MVAAMNYQQAGLRPVPVISLDRPTSARTAASPAEQYVYPPPRQVITQSMLQEYQDLKQAAAELERQRKEFQQKLLAMTDADAEVEFGELRTELVENESKVFSFEKVAAIAGVEYAKELRRHIKSTVQRYIKVVSRS